MRHSFWGRDPRAFGGQIKVVLVFGRQAQLLHLDVFVVLIQFKRKIPCWAPFSRALFSSQQQKAASKDYMFWSYSLFFLSLFFLSTTCTKFLGHTTLVLLLLLLLQNTPHLFYRLNGQNLLGQYLSELQPFAPQRIFSFSLFCNLRR